MQITTAIDRGGRHSQEDRLVVVRRGGALLGVADGHSGHEVSEYAVQNLEDVFFSATKSGLRGKKALERTFETLNFSTKNSWDGSTLSVVWIPKSKRRAHIAVLGDSPVIIKNPQGNLWISPEHNVRTNAEERKAVMARGGICDKEYIWANRDEGLQLTRALGDRAFDSLLDRNPEIFTLPIMEGSIIIPMTDGVLDPNHGTSQGTAERLLDMVQGGALAHDLVRDALRRKTHDNATAIVCIV